MAANVGCCSERLPAPILAVVIAGWLATFAGLAAAATPLEEGAKLLAEFRPAEALPLLERAQAEGPYDFGRYLQLWELTAITQAYLGKTLEAGRSFDFLLSLDPGHAISYELSPKATFLFEKARQRAANRPAPTIDVRWPSAPLVGQGIPLEIEVVADPAGFLARATLVVQTPARGEQQRYELTLLPPGQRSTVLLPPVVAEGPTNLFLSMVARDAAGNEVLRWYSPERPREVLLGYEPPTPWYGTWWVWTAVAGVVVAGAVGTALALSHEPSTTAEANFGWAP